MHTNEKPNSHDHAGAPAPEQRLQPLDNVISPAPQAGPILQMQTGLFEMGRNRSLLSGTVVSATAEAQSLGSHARSIARDTYRDQFDPAKNVHDKMHQAEYERLLDLRDEVEKGVAHAQANVHESETALAATPKAGPKPEASAWLVAAFVIAISVTVAPTLHDFLFFTILDQMLSWLGSSLCAAFVASMLTLAILSGRKTRWTWVGVVAGIVFGIGLCALRLSSAQGTAEVLFALGLTIVEVSAVLLLDWVASGLRAREAEWQTVKLAENLAVAARDAELADLDRRQKRLHEVNDSIGQKIAYVEDRANRCIHMPELEGVAIKAVLDGYNAGISENIGRLRGANGRSS